MTLNARTCMILVMLLCSNVIFGQSKAPASISLDEIKDMPQKIITAYFKPVYTAAGVSYPLMQWYAFENKVDTWDKNALNKFNASIYGFKDEPIKAATFALQFCRSFGEGDFTDNFKAIGFNSKEINCILRCYREEKKWQELDIIQKWNNEGIPQFDNNETSVSAKYQINIDGKKMKKFLLDNIKRNIFDDYIRLEISADGTYSLNQPQYDFVQISDVIPAKKAFSYADTTFCVPVFSKIKITEDFEDGIDYRIELAYNKKENSWNFKSGTFRDDYYWEKIKKSTPYVDYIKVAIEKLLDKETMDASCQYELEFSMGPSVVKVSQADKDSRYIQQEAIYNNEEIPVIELVTLYKKCKGESFFDKISLKQTNLRNIF